MYRVSTFKHRILAIADAFDGAIEAAAAARLGRNPPERALVKLGIPADAFDGTRRF